MNMTATDDVRQTNGLPLYLTVALWGMRTRQLLTTETVAREFFIPQRNASDILHYIEHEGSRVIRCERVVVTGMAGPRGRRRALRILEVQLEAVLPSEPRPPRPPEPRPGESGRAPRELSDVRKLRQWMVSRRRGETVSEVLLSENAGERRRKNR